MKKTIIPGIAFLLAFCFAGCDKIKEENRREEIPFETTSNRCVLLEDFTGVKCVNCPNAAEKIHKLQRRYGSHLVVVGMYPNNPVGLTQPYTAKDPDLRSAKAQTYADYFKIESFPNGMVNRKGEFSAYQAWSGLIMDVFDNPVDYADLTGTAAFAADKKSFDVKISYKFLEDYPAAKGVNLTVMVLEDGLVGRQLTPAEGVKKDYVFNHVMRDVASDIWGDEVASQAAAGTTGDKGYKITVADAWKAENLHVVAFLSDAASREVIQAVKIEIE